MQVISHNAPAAKFGNAGAAKTVAQKATQKALPQVTQALKGGVPHPSSGLARKLHIPKA